MSKKKVSVIIPYYKKKKFIIKTLNSIFNQTYKNFDVILIYDSMNLDDYYFIKKKYKKIKKFKILINKKNLGAGLSRNVGINNSTSEFISFCDADDLWNKDKLSYQIRMMEKYKIDFFHSSYDIIKENGKKISHFIIKEKLYYKDLIKCCDIGLSTVTLRRKFLSNKRFCSMKTKEDYLLWLQLIKKKKIFHGTHKILVSWRKTEHSLSSFFFQKIKDAYLLYNFYLKYNVVKSIFCVIRLSYYSLIKKLSLFKY